MSSTLTDSEEEFQDCIEDGAHLSTSSTGSSTYNDRDRPMSFGSTPSSSGSNMSTNGALCRPLSNDDCDRGDASEDDGTKSEWGGRRRLPTTMISRNNFSIWSFLRQCIGKELSKITMPIVFNEPLSFLQRVVEYMEYSSLILQAINCDCPIRRHELVTAFAVSATASNWERLGKPFNPMLGETYELNRQDLGLRIVCEQISHHPPISAFHAEAPQYTFHGCVNPKIKFWGSSVQVIPKGLVTLHLLRHNEVYSWQNINCSVHNVIIGKIWIEHYGEMEVVNHMTKRKSVIEFKPCGWTGTDAHRMQGYLYDADKKKLKAFYGKWIEAFYSVDVNVWDNYTRGAGKESSPQLPRPHSASNDMENDEKPEAGASCNLDLPGQKLLWSATPKPSDTSKYYNFTSFAMMLNELDDHKASCAPTDSRFRPDMRLMEASDVEAASREKNRIEEKQREARKAMKKKKDDFVPRWFRLQKNTYTGCEEWQSTGDYWKRCWDKCPDIY